MRNGVDKVRFRLGIHDPLRVIQAVVAREHVAHRNGGQVIRHAGKAEELKGNEQRGNRAICHAAEHADHAHRCRQRCIKTEQRRNHAAQRRADGQRRHNLAALEACADGQRGEDHLEQECEGFGFALVEDVLDDAHAAAQIQIAAQQAAQHQDHAAGGEDLHIGVLQVVRQQVLGLMHDHAEHNAAHAKQRAHGHRLKEQHRANLRERGLSDERMEVNGYKSMPTTTEGRRLLAHLLEANHDIQMLLKVADENLYQEKRIKHSQK